MTHPYAMQRLLEHGPLTFSEMLDITGWSRGVLEDVLLRMSRRGDVRKTFSHGCHRFVYRLP